MRRDVLVEYLVKPTFVVPLNAEASLIGLQIWTKLLPGIHIAGYGLRHSVCGRFLVVCGLGNDT